MSLTAQEVPASAYMRTGKSEPNAKAINSKSYRTAVYHHSTWKTIVILLNKHKLGLFMAAAIVQFTITALNWAFPEWTEFVKALF